MSAESKSWSAHRLLAASSVNLHYLPIQKCGCTFVKNLIWKIENGSAPNDPIRVHDFEDKIKRSSDLGFTLESLRLEERAFVVIRNPVDRFFSLYMDKVVGDGHKRFPPLRSLLSERYGLDPNAQTIEAHQANCRILIQWIARNLRDHIDIPNDPHWNPQAWRMRIITQADLKIILLSDLREGLRTLLRPAIPEIAEIMQGLEENKSEKTFSRSAVISPDIRKEINKTYSRDRQIYEKAKSYYRENRSELGLVRIGRASEVL